MSFIIYCAIGESCNFIYYFATKYQSEINALQSGHCCYFIDYEVLLPDLLDKIKGVSL